MDLGAVSMYTQWNFTEIQHETHMKPIFIHIQHVSRKILPSDIAAIRSKGACIGPKLLSRSFCADWKARRSACRPNEPFLFGALRISEIFSG